MTSGLSAITSVDDLFALEPLRRFEALVAGPNFDDYLRSEPIRFDSGHPIYGNSCRVPGCEMHSTQATWWCTQHGHSRQAARRDGIGEAQWLAGAQPIGRKVARGPAQQRLPACRFCPDRDAFVRGLCKTHTARLAYARRASDTFDEDVWAADQVAFPGAGDCLVDGCLRRAESEPSLCHHHRKAWVMSRRPDGLAMHKWLLRHCDGPSADAVFLAGLHPLLTAEIRYALWTHTQNAAPARWHPMWLRTLVKSCRMHGIQSLLELDPSDKSWTTNPQAVNRIVREMRKDVLPIHHSRAETRELGYLDTSYWGFRFVARRSPFDLTAIPQRWLRDLLWDYFASQLDGSRHPRTQGSFEQARRSIICFGTYLHDCEPHRGSRPAALAEFTARDFAADLKRRVSNAQPMRGVFNVDGTPSTATTTTYPIVMNALRKVLRWAMESGTASSAGVGREFIVAIPNGGATSFKNPRPFTDEALGKLSDPANIQLFEKVDRRD